MVVKILTTGADALGVKSFLRVLPRPGSPSGTEQGSKRSRSREAGAASYGAASYGVGASTRTRPRWSLGGLTIRQRWRFVFYAMVGNGIPMVLVTLLAPATHRGWVAAGLVVSMASGLCVAALPPLPGPARTACIPVAFVGFTMMQAHSGGIASFNVVVLFIPMLWFGLLGNRREIRVGVLALAVCSVAPMLLLGAPAFPVDWARALVVTLVGGAAALSVGALTEDARRLNHRLERDASQDALTGLLNRRGWEDGLAREHARARRSAAELSVIVLDLDGLKQVNDARGHAAGDAMLRDTAKRLRTTFRRNDLLARLGGDEFAVLLIDGGADLACASVERLREATPCDERFSAGIAPLDVEDDPERTVQQADRALYRAKEQGGDQVLLTS